MIYKNVFKLITSLVIAMLIGCASTPIPNVSGKRYVVTSLDVNNGIGIIVGRYEKCLHRKKEKCQPEEDISKVQLTFERCISNAMLRVEKSLKIIPSNKILEIIGGTLTKDKIGNAPDKWEMYLRDAGLQEELTLLNLRYLIVLDIRTEESDSYGTADIAMPVSGVPPVWSLGNELVRETDMAAHIFDLKKRTEVGEITSRVLGTRGTQVPVLCIIPLPPVHHSTRTEVGTCIATGKSIVRFLSGAGNEYIFDNK